MIVKVNDRGPFACRRIIDLSYVAAKKLGMIGHGTTKVRVRAINVYKPSSHTIFEPFFADTRRYKKSSVYLQVGAFRNKNGARRMQTQLTHLLKTPVKITAPVGSQKLYRVKIGPFPDMKVAKKTTNRLHQLGIQANTYKE